MNENEMNQLENRLHSWQPRRPSPKLKRRLFPSKAAHRSIALSLRWLAPAAACLLLALTIVNQDGRLSTGSTRRDYMMMGMISNNLSATNFLPPSHAQGRNGVLPLSFEWTNLSDFTSSVSPFSPGRMN